MDVEALVTAVVDALTGPPPHVVGIAGGVAAGKTTLANALAAELSLRGRRAAVLGTDAFLLPNAVLAERGLGMRKGFPETFDSEALVSCVLRVKAGDPQVHVPVYSHVVYDVVAGESVALEPLDVLVVEGVNSLQPEVSEALDVAIYVDADEADLRRWFTARFHDLVAVARTGEPSFYAMFASMSDEQVAQVASGTWDGINGPNLREHVLPCRERATIVVTKDAHHGIEVRAPG